MGRLKTPPNFDKWLNQYIFCVKEGFGAPETSDDAAQYTFGFSLSPEARNLGEEYKILAEAIVKEDGHFLTNFFGTPGSVEIHIQDDGSPNSCDDLKMDLQRFYSGEKGGVIYDFSIDTWHDGKTGYINDKEYNLFFYLREYPWILIDALNWFNTLSFENTTPRIKLHLMWNRLRQIQVLGFVFDESIHKEYDKLFIPALAVKAAVISEDKTRKLIKAINSFQKDYQVKKDDYFVDLAALRKETIAYAYDYKNAFEAYLGRILNSYIHHFRIIEILKACDYCGNVFQFTKNKRFCSEKDGKNCGQTVRNNRFYKKNRKILLPKARQSAREQRENYKAYGVKA